MVTVGTGPYTYEVVENCVKFPTRMTPGAFAALAVDSQGKIYLGQQQQEPPIIVFDPEGNYLTAWGSGTINEIHSIYIGPDDIAYIADRGDHIALKMTLDGKLLLEMGNRGQPSDTGCTEDEAEVPRSAGPFNRPTQLFPAPSGDLYVSDGYRNTRVHRFTADGKLTASWGEPGKSAPGEFHNPHSCWVDKQGVLYVLDRRNHRIQLYSPTNEFVGQWTNVHFPTDIFMDANDIVYLYEGHEPPDHWISVRDKQGKVLAQWDTPRGHEIWVDARGDIYLSITYEARIMKFVKKG
jgi:hypothetical protein